MEDLRAQQTQKAYADCNQGQAQTIGRERDYNSDEVKARHAAERAFTESLQDSIFDYHQPQFGQHEKYQALRDAAKAFARAIRANTPECPDQTAAIRKVREALMTANASIALEGRS